MQSTAALPNDCAGSSVTPAGVLDQPLADDRFYSEQFLADLTDQHIQTLRVARRKDAEEGTPGKRTPVPTWVSERAVRYQGRVIKNWLAERTDTPIDHAS